MLLAAAYAESYYYAGPRIDPEGLFRVLAGLDTWYLLPNDELRPGMQLGTSTQWGQLLSHSKWETRYYKRDDNGLWYFDDNTAYSKMRAAEV